MAEQVLFTNIDIEPTNDNIGVSVDVDVARGSSVAVDIPIVNRNTITIEPSGDDT